jgi:hypothetical protein
MYYQAVFTRNLFSGLHLQLRTTADTTTNITSFVSVFREHLLTSIATFAALFLNGSVEYRLDTIHCMGKLQGSTQRILLDCELLHCGEATLYSAMYISFNFTSHFTSHIV